MSRVHDVDNVCAKMMLHSSIEFATKTLRCVVRLPGISDTEKPSP